jgi:hypothetical protein
MTASGELCRADHVLKEVAFLLSLAHSTSAINQIRTSENTLLSQRPRADTCCWAQAVPAPTRYHLYL